ncbi:hypothetical protein EDD16DRAFT_1546472 [Pisolithus croceorrhizus]|nr:hypothetical protein EDD16DRAFT_1546472 [Pisolithus croceorrhizus]
MLSRCKMAMLICTSQPFVQGPAASTLIGRLATALGPEAWLYEDVRIQPIMPSWGIALPHPNIYLTAHHPTFRNVADRQTRDFHVPTGFPQSLHNHSLSSRRWHASERHSDDQELLRLMQYYVYLGTGCRLG